MFTPTKAANRDRIAKDAQTAFVLATQNPSLPRGWLVVEIRWLNVGPVTHGGKAWSSASAALRLSARLALREYDAA